MFSEGIDKKMIASRGLARFWQSGSGGHGSEIKVFSKASNKNMIAPRALASFWKCGSGRPGAEMNVLVKELIRK